VDFDIPSPGTFSYNSIVNINKNHVIIDGYTQPGSAIWGPGTAISTTTPFILPITINFTSFSSTGLNIINDSCSVSGVKISSTNSAFTINNADYFHLFGSQIFNCNFGIHAQYTENTLIGGLALHSKNVIQDCDSAGIYFSSSHQAVITNNFIGTDLAGNNPAPCNIGVKIINSSYINLPGDYRWFSGNLISGNDEAGIDIINSSNVFVLGNFIGTDRLGLNALPNKTGVIIRNNSDSVYVGVNTLAGRNLISGNDNHGIEISNFNNQSFLSISNNYIGTNYFGNAALANEDDGIFIQNKLNGNTLIKNNLISGNDENGVNISSSNYISLSGNIIGLNTSQTAVLANGNSGVYAENSYFLNIGLTTDNRNIISGNTQQGIHFNNVDYSSILNSYIGISNNGSSFGNIEHGILVENGSYAINIGSHTDSLIVANNNAHGIYIRGTSDGVDIKPFRIENNGLLGISLDNNNTPNPNPNDTDDTDTGPNGLQNYPLIQVKNCGNTTNASGMLYIDAGIGYRLDFFLSSSPPDPSQHGEAGKFLYTYIFTTGITGIYNFDITLPYVPTGSYVTATASKQISSGVMATSEFSLNTQVSLVNIVPNVTVTEPLCFNDITGAINVSPSGGVQPYIFSLYDVGNVQIGTSFTGNNYYHNLLGAGTYYLHIQESAGCAMIDTIIINQPQALTLNLSVNNETCLGFNDGSVILSASGGTSPYQFSQDGVNYNTITQYANLSPGVYTFYVTDNNNCNVNQSATINQGVAQPLPPIFNPSIYEFCLTAQPVTANANYTVYWYTDSTLTNLIYTGNPYTTMIPGWVTYYVTQELNNCHSNPSTVSILLINEQLVQDGSPYYGCSDLPVQINVGVSAPGSTIQWSSAAEISDLASFTPLITAAASNSYFYNVNIPYLSGNSTCIITDSIYVEINNSPDCGLTSTYNAFSPNGDGINDVWIIDGAYFYPLNRVTIFNRWGNKLLNFNNYDNRNVVWDGSYKGEILPSGTYFYLIEFIEVNKSITGWVQITR
jgi:gliding motility-associated-like protein